jgi:hypothetical protein
MRHTVGAGKEEVKGIGIGVGVGVEVEVGVGVEVGVEVEVGAGVEGLGPRRLNGASPPCYLCAPRPAPLAASSTLAAGNRRFQSAARRTMTDPHLLDELILSAQKPSRYVGGEFGAIRKDLSAARLRFALAFPDTYEVGMSNLGFRLLYHALNDVPGIACERAFLPWPDLEGMLRERGLPLFSI